MARDVPAPQWQQWFNGPVQQVFHRSGFFDPQGIFIGDASYVFVPDNEAYAGSVRLWFDEHHHPVDYEELDPVARRRCTRRRCYKWVSLLHWRDGAYVYAAVALVPGHAHECPILYELVRQFVSAVGLGVMKWLILDRGFNPAQSAEPPPPPPPAREVCRLTDLKCFYDLTGFRSRSFDAITSQVVFVLLTYTLRQWQLWRLKQTAWAGLTPPSLEQKLAIHQQWIVIYFQCAYVQLPLVTFTRELLELADAARAKALAKVRQLEECMLAPVTPLRPRPP